MSDDSQVQQLLDELFNTHRTPEEVCVAHPELLPEVRERWRQIRRVEADLDAVFPPPLEPGASAQAPTQKGPAFPSIPGYELESVLGRGGMGIVFRARDMRLKRVVALKMVLAGEYAGPQERLRFQREAEAVAGLRHPNIVQIHDIGDSDGRPYFTMEYVEAGSLAQKLAGTPQPSRDAAAMLATLAIAVQAAHICGIIHRDLKPGNVLLTADGTPKISDFGLARRVDGETALTRTGIAVGTPSYMAPEQAVGIAPAGPAVDIYALGAILYELLTGRPPFLAETAAQTIQQVISQDPVPPSRLNATVPRDLETICLKCLGKEPGLRYVSAAALADDLQRFLRGEAIAARPEGRFERLVRQVRRRPAISAAVAVSTLLTFALIGGGLWMFFERDAAARVVEARESAAHEDLNEMEHSLKTSSWLKAKEAMERAKGRLGELGAESLRTRWEQGAHELGLVARLEAIRVRRTATIGGYLDFPRSTKEYEVEFRKAKLGQVDEDAGVVAERVKATNIRDALVATLDDWSIWDPDPRRKKWALAVASKADPDPTGWRNRARALVMAGDMAALTKVLETAPTAQLADQQVPLLLALEHRVFNAQNDTVPFARRLQQAHPNDFWANLRLGQRLYSKKSYTEALRYYQAALALLPETHIAHHEVGVALAGSGRHIDAVEHFRHALKIDPTARITNYALGVSLHILGQHNEAIDNIKLVLGTKLDSAIVRNDLGISLEAVGRGDEAVEEYRRAIAMSPKFTRAQKSLRELLMRQHRADEARAAWQAALAADPPEHEAWSGYAEFCLFLGQVDEYRSARQSLLAKFAGSADPFIAERTSRACLVLPPSEDELRKAVALADRAVAFDRTKFQPGAYPHFLFVKGLADYRQGRLDQTIAAMQGDASRVPGPSPRLLLAMALYRKGQQAEARKKLAEAIVAYDWRTNKMIDHDGTIRHILRREAENMILPDLPAFLKGNHQPQDNEERLALLGVCQSTNRCVVLARLYTDAFDADPQLAGDFGVGHRFNAACAAAQAGRGTGDGADLAEPERAKWRTQARVWLRADLAAWKKWMDGNLAKATARDLVRQRLTQWQRDHDLGSLREPMELLKLSADERRDCVTLWDDVSHVIKSSQVK